MKETEKEINDNFALAHQTRKQFTKDLLKEIEEEHSNHNQLIEQLVTKLRLENDQKKLV